LNLQALFKGEGKMKVSDLQRLFAYEEWANREVLTSFQRAGSPPEQGRKRLAHILGAEDVWHSRITKQNSPLAVWPDLTVSECEQHATRMADLWRSYLSSLADQHLMQTVNYRNSKGEPWTSTVEDILLHVLMHGAHHRGQIAADIRAAGHTPAYTDFIHAVRQNLLE
jgi:uncharacterized damage-inducible protein DinB